MSKPIISVRFDGENIIPLVDGVRLDAVKVPTIRVNLSTNSLGFHHIDYRLVEETANAVTKILIENLHKSK